MRRIRSLTSRRAGTESPAPTSDASSRPPSVFQVEEGIPQPVDRKSQQPRQAIEPGKEWSASDRLTSQRAEVFESHEDEDRVRVSSSSPENIHSSWQYATNLQTVTTNVTATTTKVEDWDGFARETFVHAPRAVPPMSPRITSFSSRAQSPSVASDTLFMGTQNFMHHGSLKDILQERRLRREEKDRMLDSAVAEYEDIYEQRLEALGAENARLVQELSASKSRVTLLEIQLYSRGDSQSGTTSQHNKISSTITTTITAITTAVTTVTTRIEQWKHRVGRNKGQITISSNELEQLVSDLSIATSQMTDVQDSYAGLWKDFSSVLGESQAAMSLSDEKDRSIATLSAEVTRWKSADAAKAEQISTVRRDNETLKVDLSATSSRMAVLQQRYETQSKELSHMRKDLQTKTSLIEERDRTNASLTAEVVQWRQSDVTKAEQIITARQDYQKLQRDHSASLSQTAELQKRYDAQSKEFSSVQNELQTNRSLVEEKERTIVTLATEVDQWKRADGIKAQQLAAEHQVKERIQRDLTASSSRMANLQKQYDAQSRDIITIRNELQTKISLLEKKEDAITSLTTEVTQARREDSVKAAQIVAARRDIEQLRQELTSTSDRFSELQERYTIQSQELSSVRDELRHIETLDPAGGNHVPGKSKSTVAQHIAHALEEKNKQVEELRRDLASATTRSTELQTSYETLSSELNTLRDQLSMQASQYEDTIASLTAQVHQWKRSDSAKSEQTATTLKQVEKLQKELSTSASELAELHGRHEVQSRDLVVLRTELQTSTSSSEAKDRTIASLNAEIDQWKRTDANKAEEIATTLKRLEELQRDSSSLASQLAELQGRYEVQSRELSSVHGELQTNTSLHEEKDHTIASLTAELEHRKRTDAAKAEQMTATIKQVERIQRDLSNSSSVADVQRRYLAQSQELMAVRNELQSTIFSVENKDRIVAALTVQVEELKHTNAWKEEHIVSARRQFEDLQRRYGVQMAELTSQIEQWKHSDAANAEELTTARKKLQQLQHELSASASRATELQQRCEVQSTELTFLRDQLQATLSLGGGKSSTVAALDAQIEQWKHANAAKVQELEQLQRRLFTSSSELEALRKSSTSISEETRKVYEKITTKEVRDYSAVVKLTTRVDEWLRADAKRAESLTLELERRDKENEELRRDLVILKEIYVRAPELKQIFQSETTEIQQHYEEELTSTFAERQSRLEIAQPFLNASDKYADTTILQMLQKLNAEVQQNTTFIADCVLRDFRPQTSGLTKEQSSAVQTVSNSIGKPLTDCLANASSDDVGLYLPIAFQAYFTYYLYSIISSWTLKNECSQFINEIYERLQKSEAQVTSGRWRSLTRTYISPTSMSNVDAMVKVILAGLSDIVVVAGCAASVDNVQFGNKVLSIISIAEKLSKMVWEVVSADFEVTAPQPFQIFEDASMEEDVDDDDKGQNASRKPAMGQKVLCSTQLGMTKRIQSESGSKDTLTVSKARVVVESFLHH